MRSRSNGGIIGAYQLPTQNYANGVFFIHDAAIYNTGNNPIWPLSSGFVYSATGGTIATAPFNNNYKTHTFYANSAFSVVTGGGYLDILIVGGGGGGGTAKPLGGTGSTYYPAAGGGGGGSVTVVRTWAHPGTTFTVEVGEGGAIGTSLTAFGRSGKPSKVSSTMGHNYISLGGSQGHNAGDPAWVGGAINAGNGGGGATWNATYAPDSLLSTAAITSGTFIDGSQGGGSYVTYGNNGGTSGAATTPYYRAGGGGGGAGGPGYDAHYSFDLNKASAGGDGYLWPVTNMYYGAGGGGGRVYNSTYSPLPAQLQTTSFGGKIYTGSVSYGAGMYQGTTSGSGTASSGLGGYGSGGGGGAIYGATTSYFGLGGAGGGGCVIFCYRYQ